MSCKIKVRRRNNMPVIKIVGELSGEESGRISQKIISHGKNKSRAVVIDLSETTFIDSHGLGVLVYAWKTLEQRGNKLVFLNPPQFVQTLMRGTNLSSVITVVESLDSI
jgi:anti-anti-sigma factor